MVRVPKSGELTCRHASTPSGSCHRMNIPGPDVIFEEDKVADGVLPDDVVGEGCDVADEETCVELAERSVADAVEAVVSVLVAVMSLSIDGHAGTARTVFRQDATDPAAVRVFQRIVGQLFRRRDG
jgi:hypothetical protein